MAKQRYLPFGYRIRNGKIQIDPEEGKLIPEIFASYLSGSTMQEIADHLQLTGVQYSKANSVWSKHMVHRILENRKYCGEKEFPALIDLETFEKTARLRQQKRSEPLPGIGLLRKHMRCAQCNSKLKLDLGTRGKIFWKCSACGIRIGPIPNDFLSSTVAAGMNHFIENPSSFRAIPPQSSPVPLKIERLNREFERITDHSSIDTDRAVSMLFERAQLQYEILKPVFYDPNTLKLCQIYSGRSPTAEIDSDLFQESVQSILLSSQGDIQIRFINGQIYPEQEAETSCHPK